MVRRVGKRRVLRRKDIRNGSILEGKKREEVLNN